MSTAVGVTEDDIIRRRLLYDGDGSGDEKRITTILKTIIKWSTTKCDEEENHITYQKIVALLQHCEYCITKHHFAFLMNTKEQKNYEELYENIKEQIEVAREDINLCKEELKHAKIVRKNKQEYDSLAKIIEKHPDRKSTKTDIEKLEKEISCLNEKKEDLMQKLDMRQKQFHVLIYSVQLLQQIINDEETTNDDSSSIVNKQSTSSRKSPVEVMEIS